MHFHQPSFPAAALLAALLPTFAAGAVEAPQLTLTPPARFNLYAEGVAPSLEIAWTNGLPAEGSVRVRGLDAWGEAVFGTTAAVRNGQAHLQLPKVAAFHRYLKLEVSANGRDAFPPTAISCVVLPPSMQQDERFGFNAQPPLAPIVRQLGGRWVRNHIPWEQNAADQPFRTNGIERVIRETREGDCEVCGISSYSLPWASVVGTNDDRPMRENFSVPRPEPWDAYMRFAGQEIRGRVPVFEVWNEWNFDMFWRSVPDTPEQRLDDYAALLKRSYAILKKEAPELRVTTGSMVTTRHSDSLAQFQGLLARGCAGSFDILNVHYYSGGRAPEGKTWDPADTSALDGFLDAFTNILATAHLATPIWMTEMGWSSTDPGWGYVNEFDQACNLVRSHVLCFSRGVEIVLWFKLDGEPFGIMTDQAGAKPAAAAYAQLVRALHGRVFAGTLSADTTRAYRFDGPAGALLIAWSKSPAAWTPPPGFAPQRAANMLGEPVPLRRGRAIPLSPAPIYVWGVWPSPSEVR